MRSSHKENRVLVTGHQGYIGSVLTRILTDRGYEVIGVDAGYFAENLWDSDPSHLVASIQADIRDLDVEFLRDLNVGGIIHLAGLSNDPLGEFDPHLTEAINYSATVRLAEMAREVAVSRLVYFSSQSMYGVSSADHPLDEDAPKSPVTAYADTKWRAEQILLDMSSETFVVTALRPSTVYGPSPRFRADIIMNNMTALAIERGEVVMRTDGTPWRPIVHVDDVSQAAVRALEADRETVSGRPFNIGYIDGNFTVQDIAEAVAQAANVPIRADIIESDPRSYQVNFDSYLNSIGQGLGGPRDLHEDARDLFAYLSGKKEQGFELLGPGPYRLRQLQDHVDSGALTPDLRWKTPTAEVIA